jgi:hypothetical protein
MNSADNYRTQAAKLRAQARNEKSLHVRQQLESMADCYIRLAIQADRNQGTDVIYEPPVHRVVPDNGEPV